MLAKELEVANEKVQEPAEEPVASEPVQVPAEEPVVASEPVEVPAEWKCQQKNQGQVNQHNY